MRLNWRLRRRNQIRKITIFNKQKEVKTKCDSKEMETKNGTICQFMPIAKG